MTRLRLPILLAALLGPGAALACMPPDPSTAYDLPIAVQPDGSFEHASSNDDASQIWGGPARDVGGGRVGQVMQMNGGCQVEQRLIFVDCTTGESALIDGIPGGPEESPPVARSTRALQPPYGPLRLGPATTVAEVAALGAREGWHVQPDAVAALSWAVEPNRIDPFIGCRIFYPGSVGASR